jgi:hypothetical protein
MAEGFHVHRRDLKFSSVGTFADTTTTSALVSVCCFEPPPNLCRGETSALAEDSTALLWVTARDHQCGRWLGPVLGRDMPVARLGVTHLQLAASVGFPLPFHSATSG